MAAMTQILHCSLFIAMAFAHAKADTIVDTVCPPIALALVLDGSGSISNSASGPCGIEGKRNCDGKTAVKKFANAVIDAVQSGPRSRKSQFSAVKFGSGSEVLAGLTEDYRTVKQLIDHKYSVTGATNIPAGIEEGRKLLSKAPEELAKVMVVLSDGKNNRGGTPADAAKAAKDQGITIFAVGFAQAHVDEMEGIAGNLSYMAKNGLSELKEFIETQFCKKIKIVLPPTPAPTPACGVDRLENEDDPWDGCVGDLCNHFKHNNGSSELCLRYARDNLCQNDVDGIMTQFCHCTCGRCCDPTPAPTPAPTETDTPTPIPTQEPTIPDCKPNFVLDFSARANWISAKEVLESFFESTCYDWATDWPKMIGESRVKVVRDGNVYRFDSDDGILKEPFEPMNITICMPEGFPKDCDKTVILEPKSSAQHMLAQALAPLLALIFLW